MSEQARSPRPPTDRLDPATRTGKRAVRRGWYLLLVLPFVGMLWLPFYATAKPRLFGFPFFYWYQFAWVLVGSAITATVYALTTARDDDRAGTPGDGR